jgi:DNA-binding MarR family transcriptional regulator
MQRARVCHSTLEKVALIEAALLADPEHSNRLIAEPLGVDHKTVAAIRRQLIEDGRIDDHARLLGADGKWRPAKRTM